MKTSARLLYVYNVKTTFIDIDLALLRRRYEVRECYIARPHPKLFPQMWQATSDVDAVITWFASWHSLPVFMAAYMRGIPRVLTTGGYDVADEPSIGYGLRQGGIPRLISDIVFRLTTLALPFSQTATRETLQNTPLSADRTIALPLGVPDDPVFVAPVTKEHIALTVATLDATSIPRKGIDVFVAAAEHLPQVSFLVVGKVRDDSAAKLRANAPANVKFTGYLSDDELRDLRQRASVYVQPSVHEGFGLAVAESMLARCVPVVSRAGALPEVVGELGIFTERTPEMVADAIKVALESDATYRERCRQRILTHFSPEERARQLYQHLDQLLSHP